MKRIKYDDLKEKCANLENDIEDKKYLISQLRSSKFTKTEIGLILDSISLYEKTNKEMAAQYDIDFVSIRKKLNGML